MSSQRLQAARPLLVNVEYGLVFAAERARYCASRSTLWRCGARPVSVHLRRARNMSGLACTSPSWKAGRAAAARSAS